MSVALKEENPMLANVSASVKREQGKGERDGEDDSETSSTCDSAVQKNPYLPWTPEEDQTIIEVIKELTAENTEKANSNVGRAGKKLISWVKVSNRMNGRSPKQCRERWRNALNPHICHEHWTTEEDLRLLTAQKRIGNRWVQIAAGIPGRTENGVKTRYKSIMRAKKRAWRKSEDSQLMRLYNHAGPNWLAIAREIPGRSLNGIKLRYRHLLSGAPSNPEPGSPEQAIPIFFTGYGNENCRYYFPQQTPRNPPPLLSSPKSSTSEAEASAACLSSRNAFTFSNLDAVHPIVNKKRRGTMAVLLDKIERENSTPTSEFATMIANVLDQAPEDDDAKLSTDLVNPMAQAVPNQSTEIGSPDVYLNVLPEYQPHPKRLKLASF